VQEQTIDILNSNFRAQFAIFYCEWSVD